MANPDMMYITATLRGSEDEMVGVLGINRHKAIFYVFDPDRWGKGYCTEAMRVFLTELFKIPEWREKGSVDAWILEGNQASIRVVERLGFVPDQAKADIVWGFLQKEKAEFLEQAEKGEGGKMMRDGKEVRMRNDWIRRPLCWTFHNRTDKA